MRTFASGWSGRPKRRPGTPGPSGSKVNKAKLSEQRKEELCHTLGSESRAIIRGLANLVDRPQGANCPPGSALPDRHRPSIAMSRPYRPPNCLFSLGTTIASGGVGGSGWQRPARAGHSAHGPVTPGLLSPAPSPPVASRDCVGRRAWQPWWTVSRTTPTTWSSRASLVAEGRSLASPRDLGVSLGASPQTPEVFRFLAPG